MSRSVTFTFHNHPDGVSVDMGAEGYDDGMVSTNDLAVALAHIAIKAEHPEKLLAQLHADAYILTRPENQRKEKA